MEKWRQETMNPAQTLKTENTHTHTHTYHYFRCGKHQCSPEGAAGLLENRSPSSSESLANRLASIFLDFAGAETLVGVASGMALTFSTPSDLAGAEI